MKTPTRTTLQRVLYTSVIAALFCAGSPAFAANSLLDLNDVTAGFGDNGTADLTSSLTWTTDTNGIVAPIVFPAGNGIQIGVLPSDFNGDSITVNMSLANNLTANPGVFNIVSTNVTVTMSGSANCRWNHAFTWTVPTGSTLIVTSTGNNNGFNFNSQPATFTGGGIINFMDTFAANGNSSGGITINMPGGTVQLNQTKTSNFGNSASAGGVILTNGTLQFVSSLSLADTFQAFIAGGPKFALNGGTIDNLTGAAGTISLGTASYSIGGNFTFTGTSSLSFSNNPVTLTNGNRQITVVSNVLSIGGVISGTGSGLTKAGAGELLLSGVNTYAGNTVVAGGTLALSNTASISSSPLISVMDNTTLDLSGLTVRMNAGTMGFTNSTLALSTFNGGTNIQVGNLNPGGTTNVINLISIPIVLGYPTTFHLIAYSNLNGAFNFVLGSVPPVPGFPFLGFITNNAATKTVDYVLTNGPVPVRQLTWNGSDINGGNWDIGNSLNWTDTNHTAVTYQESPNGDLVRFDDTATGVTTVNLASTLSPSALTVSNVTKTYTFSGGGTLNGSFSLVKQGTGKLVMDNSSANTYSGGTTLSGGTVQIGNNDGAGDLGSGNVVNNGTLIWDRSDQIALNNNISGSGSFVQNGPGTLTLGGASSFSGTVIVNQGVLQAGTATALGTNTITIANGASLDLGGNALTNRQIIVSGPGTNGYGAIDNTGVNIFPAVTFVTLTGNTTFGTDAGGASTTRGRWDLRSPGGTTGSASTASLSTSGQPYTLTKIGSELVGIVSVTVDPKLGAIDIQGGTLDYEGNTTGLGDPAYNLTIESGATLQFFAPTVPLTKPIILHATGTIDNNSGANTLLSPISLPDASGNGSLKIDGTTTLTVSSPIGGPGNLSQVGATGTLNLNGTNTFAGTITLFSGIMNLNGDDSAITNATAVDAGTLNLNTVLGGSITAGPGTVLIGNGTNLGLVDVSGVFSPGTTNTPGTFTANGGFTLESGGTASFDLAFTNAPGGGINDLVVVNGDLNFNGGNIAINPVGILNLGAKYRLFTYTGLLPNQPPTPQSIAGYNFTIDTSIAGEVDVVASGGPPLWNGGSLVNNNWSDPNNWSGTAPTGGSPLYFLGPNRLNTVNDTATDTSYGDINFIAGAFPFTLTGNPIMPAGNIINNSTNAQTIDLGVDFNANFTMNGAAGPLVIGGGLTNTATTFNKITLAGTGILTNLLTSVDPNGTNTIMLNSASANWTLVDNPTSTQLTIPWLLNVSNGTFTFGTATSAPKLNSTTVNGQPQDFFVGSTANATATFNMSNGVLTTQARLNTGVAANATGIVNQSGGIFNMGSQFQGANSSSNSVSIVNLSGGTMNIGSATNSTSPFYVASRGPGTLNVSGNAALNCGTLDVSRSINSLIPGIVNLNGGTVSVTSVSAATANSTAGATGSTGTVNFNGGTLMAATNSTTWFQGRASSPTVPLAAIVKTGGASINDGGFAVTFIEPLQHDGSGPATDGGLTKQGAGTLTLAAPTNTYTGVTLVRAGTLAVNGVLGTNSVTVGANATLSGTGTINGKVTINPNGTISPGGANAIGKLTIGGALSLQGTAFMELSKSGSPTNDSINGPTLIDYAGSTLQLTNISTNALAVGDSFKLFTATAYTNSFANILPATPGPGLLWNTNNLPINGTLSVTNFPALPATIGSVSITGTTFTIHASGGAINGSFRVLSSTNVAAKVSTWPQVGSGSYDGSGNAVFNGTFNSSDTSRYFVIVSP